MPRSTDRSSKLPQKSECSECWVPTWWECPAPLEAIAGRQMGAEVLGISLVTNLGAGMEEADLTADAGHRSRRPLRSDSRTPHWAGTGGYVMPSSLRDAKLTSKVKRRHANSDTGQS